MVERIYLQHPARGETVELSTGFSWGACLLGFIWPLMKKMWLVASLMLVADLVIGLIGLAGVTADVLSLLLSVAFAVYCGMKANQWYRRDLERKGYYKGFPVKRKLKRGSLLIGCNAVRVRVRR